MQVPTNSKHNKHDCVIQLMSFIKMNLLPIMLLMKQNQFNFSNYLLVPLVFKNGPGEIAHSRLSCLGFDFRCEAVMKYV